MTTTITGLPNGTTPLDGTERVPMDQAGVTVDATTQDIADLSAEIQQLTCRNQTGSTIAKGTAVSFAGTLGASGILLIKKTVADGTDPGYVFLGIAKEQILNGETGEVATFGKILEVDTSAFSEGSILWCDPATPGGLTETEPEAPNLKLPVAVVINSGGANGSLMVRSNIGSRLVDLHDVQANGSKTDGDALRWDAAAERWQPAALGGAAALDVGTTPGTVAAGDDSRFTPAARSTSTAGVLPATSFAAITYGATVNLDMAALDGQYRTISLTGNLTLTSSNRDAGRMVVIRLIADASDRTLTFPADWKFLGTKPASIAASKTGVLSLTFFGTADADCVAAWGVQG